MGVFFNIEVVQIKKNFLNIEIVILHYVLD